MIFMSKGKMAMTKTTWLHAAIQFRIHPASIRLYVLGGDPSYEPLIEFPPPAGCSNSASTSARF
jgi:hypothetical protein